MKEFEKQYDEGCGIIVNCGSLTCEDCKIMQAAIWRAALEWSQGINKKITEEYSDNLYGCIKQSLAIDVELKGELES